MEKNGGAINGEKAGEKRKGGGDWGAVSDCFQMLRSRGDLNTVGCGSA